MLMSPCLSLFNFSVVLFASRAFKYVYTIYLLNIIIIATNTWNKVKLLNKCIFTWMIWPSNFREREREVLAVLIDLYISFQSCCAKQFIWLLIHTWGNFLNVKMILFLEVYLLILLCCHLASIIWTQKINQCL